MSSTRAKKIFDIKNDARQPRIFSGGAFSGVTGCPPNTPMQCSPSAVISAAEPPRDTEGEPIYEEVGLNETYPTTLEGLLRAARAVEQKSVEERATEFRQSHVEPVRIPFGRFRRDRTPTMICQTRILGMDSTHRWIDVLPNGFLSFNPLSFVRFEVAGPINQIYLAPYHPTVVSSCQCSFKNMGQQHTRLCKVRDFVLTASVRIRCVL